MQDRERISILCALGEASEAETLNETSISPYKDGVAPASAIERVRMVAMAVLVVVWVMLLLGVF